MKIKQIITAYCQKHQIGICRPTPTNHTLWEFSSQSTGFFSFDIKELKRKINKSSKIKITIPDLVEAFEEDTLCNDIFAIPPVEYKE